MIKFFIKLNKPLFLAYLHNFLGKKSFTKITGSVMQNFIMVSDAMPKFKKSNDPIPRKHPGRRKERQKDRRTDPTLKDPSGYQQGSKKYNCSRLALKVKETEDVGLTKNYCITTSMQKISSIHKLILKKL